MIDKKNISEIEFNKMQTYIRKQLSNYQQTLDPRKLVNFAQKEASVAAKMRSNFIRKVTGVFRTTRAPSPERQNSLTPRQISKLQKIAKMPYSEYKQNPTNINELYVSPNNPNYKP